ncbi:hypothetical protein ACFTAO_46310 [Paenibacillus rhizoplanae]
MIPDRGDARADVDGQGAMQQPLAGVQEGAAILLQRMPDGVYIAPDVDDRQIMPYLILQHSAFQPA